MHRLGFFRFLRGLSIQSSILFSRPIFTSKPSAFSSLFIFAVLLTVHHSICQHAVHYVLFSLILIPSSLSSSSSLSLSLSLSVQTSNHHDHILPDAPTSNHQHSFYFILFSSHLSLIVGCKAKGPNSSDRESHYSRGARQKGLTIMGFPI